MKYSLEVGKRYGHLVVTEDFVMKHRTKSYKCFCDCGEVVYQSLANLENGIMKSCGCKMAEFVSKSKTTHGYCRRGRAKRLYRIYRDMKHRCYKQNDISYGWYGAKGIRVCDEWLVGFENFEKWAISNGYADNLTLDRKDANEDYSPHNCRFVSTLAQALNRRKGKNNTSGKVGVYKEQGRWRARLEIHGRNLSFGSYDTFGEASRARDLAEIKHHDPHRA